MIQFNEYKTSSYWLRRTRNRRIANNILSWAALVFVFALIIANGGAE